MVLCDGDSFICMDLSCTIVSGNHNQSVVPSFSLSTIALAYTPLKLEYHSINIGT